MRSETTDSLDANLTLTLALPCSKEVSAKSVKFILIRLPNFSVLSFEVIDRLADYVEFVYL